MPHSVCGFALPAWKAERQCRWVLRSARDSSAHPGSYHKPGRYFGTVPQRSSTAKDWPVKDWPEKDWPGKAGFAKFIPPRFTIELHMSTPLRKYHAADCLNGPSIERLRRLEARFADLDSGLRALELQIEQNLPRLGIEVLPVKNHAKSTPAATEPKSLDTAPAAPLPTRRQRKIHPK